MDLLLLKEKNEHVSAIKSGDRVMAPNDRPATWFATKVPKADPGKRG
jgi:hypothetical protein